MPDTISEQSILDALHRVPRERWGDVLQFLDALEAVASPGSEPRPVLTGKDLAGSDLIGIWADRTDLGASREYARQLRQQASHRMQPGRPDAP